MAKFVKFFSKWNLMRNMPNIGNLCFVGVFEPLGRIIDQFGRKLPIFNPNSVFMGILQKSNGHNPLR